MLKCDICLCWQHGECIDITSENAPKNYVCWICFKYQKNNNSKKVVDVSRGENNEMNKLLEDCTEHYSQLNLLIYSIDCKVAFLK